MAVSTLPSAQRIDYTTTLDRQTKIIIMVGVLLGLFLSALDQTIVSTAMPRIIQDLNGLDLLAWVSTAYLLTNTAMVPIYGKLSDIYGRKIVLIAGILIFMASSVLCGMATSMLQLVLFRGLQGLGGAALTSTAFAVPADLFVPAERPKLQGLTTAVFGLASVVGPYLGGLLTDNLSWHWVFLVNLPVGLVALAFIIFKMPKLDSGLRPKIDYAGAALLLVTVVPLLLGLTWDKTTHGWGSPLILGMFGLSAVGLLGFWFAEKRAESPILSFDLFRNKVFALIIPVSILVGAAFFAAVLFLSLYLVNVLGVSATQAGTALMPLMGGLVFGSITSSIIVQRLGRYKEIMLFGMLLMAGGFWWLRLMDLDTTLWMVRARMVVVGAGLGLSMPILTLALQNAVAPHEMGSATAGRQFFQQLGQVIGSAVFGVILTSTLTSALETNLAPVKEHMSPAMAAQFDISAMRNGAGAGEGAAGETVSIEERITGAIGKGLDAQSALLARAAEGDQAARGQLLADENTLPFIKEALGKSETLDAAQLAMLQGGLEQARPVALERGRELAKEIDLGMKQAFTTSITSIYVYALVLIAIGFLIALFIPQLPLRKTNHAPLALE
ncbi:MAG TPA: MDR family MFS transporter [Herpetosiphonaceae bacterium]